ncbi:DoxX family protein [Streptomyces sp. A0642]|uniref:DoxX family protein n=1 Tax=Streptomyces sp. A0642 TaxID=2563100 RepID=UPI0010A28304|nr:DoxX family protein [Streptomyces sp. A0642]THA77713.1 DoxX family protein [Streptomyces sp. A0642]
MTTVLLVLTVLCIVANAFIATADYAKAGFVVKNSTEVHLPLKVLPRLATSKLAGAVGLLVGLAWLPWLGLAAGIGLTVFFIGAVIAHVRAGIYRNIAFPSLYLLLAAGSASYMAHQVGS